MPAQITAGGSQRAGLRTAVLGTYRRQYEAQRDMLSKCMDLDFPSDSRSEYYFYWESAPHLGRWAYGGDLPFEGFRGIQFEVVNHRWAKGISWQADDEADDQTRDLINQARGLGQSAANLDERVFFQICNGSTDSELLPTVPNAPDGSATFLAGSRFGFATGNSNSVTGGAPTTAALARVAYFEALEAVASFQDTKSQPLHSVSVTGGTVVCIGNPADADAVMGGFKRSELVQGTQAGVSDEIRGDGRVVETWINQLATASQLLFFWAEAPVKAVFSQLREPLSEAAATDANSDRAREADEHYIRFKMRKGFGAALPTAAMEMTA